jgi:hypothetical protein
VLSLLEKLTRQDIHKVRLEGEGDVADVCRLTCMEQHFTLTDEPSAPALVVDGLKVRLVMDEKKSES